MSDFNWEPVRGGNIPAYAVLAGHDTDGGPIYAGRASFRSELLPAKVVPNHQVAYVPFAGSEHRVDNYEVLVTRKRIAWQPDSDGSVPTGALPVGTARNKETLYMARVEYNNSLTPGKVHPSHGVCYIPFGGKELAFRQYSVLVLQP